MERNKKDFNLDFRQIASSTIVVTGSKAAMLIKNNGTGNLLVFPLFLDYSGTEADFRIDYFNKLVEANKENKLEPPLFFRYFNRDGTEECIIVGKELFEILGGCIGYHDSIVALEERLKKYPSWLRPIMRLSTRDFLMLITIVMSGIVNVILCFYVKK